ncbi:MAG: HAD-IA family hydrolase [Candidatus Omnitrophica bacterium]|nr:HAD-IA family hydrolase [Candidatus Omnitrophota bacterium]
MKRLIVYDLDGTLVDTGEDIANAANFMLQQMSEAPKPADDVKALVGRGLHDLVHRCLETTDPQRIERGLQLFYEHYQAHLLASSALYPGAADVLEHFRSRIQAIVTNKPQPLARQVIEGLGVAGHFADIIGAGSPYPKKPDPAAIRALMARWQLHPTDVLFVGDSLVDFETGRNAGVTTALLTHGYAEPDELRQARPDALVGNFHELLETAIQQGW